MIATSIAIIIFISFATITNVNKKMNVKLFHTVKFTRISFDKYMLHFEFPNLNLTDSNMW